MLDENKIRKLKGCTSDDILKIEELLNIKLGYQFKDYLKKYGAVYIDNKEFFGFTENENFHLNVVKNTLDERTKYGNILDNYVVFENDGSGNLTLVDNHDNVYHFSHDSKKISKWEFENDDTIVTFNAYIIVTEYGNNPITKEELRKRILAGRHKDLMQELNIDESLSVDESIVELDKRIAELEGDGKTSYSAEEIITKINDEIKKIDENKE